MTFKSSSSSIKATDAMDKKSRSKLNLKIGSFGSQSSQIGKSPKVIQKKSKLGVKKSDSSQDSFKNGINQIRSQHTKSASFALGCQQKKM